MTVAHRTPPAGIDPAIVAEAVRLGIIDAADVDRFLHPPAVPSPVAVVELCVWPTDPAQRLHYAVHRAAASGAPAKCPTTWVTDQRNGRRVPAPDRQPRPIRSTKHSRRNR